MASAGARAYNGGVGRSPQRGPGAEPLVTGSGGEAPKAEEVLVFGRPITLMKAEKICIILCISLFLSK